MEINGVQICNVCLKPSDEVAGAVYIKAVANGEDIHVCTSCIPVIIHGDGSAIKTNETVKEESGR
ncbi:MAG: hypothetical protein PWQ42_519 [Sulfurospirillum sp.]|jgi:hypothetical protein|nr:hypothetical protein [Sulfurospirillum sp.]DAB31665.1 MAG TPA: hypothetical protein CFH79_07945 [Sulfurospirillum sp. UBA11407]DAB35429.1 MAG TPA: hypothetical protein CFH82_00210 [Sulfurospirillum sp. UBA12182]